MAARQHPQRFFALDTVPFMGKQTCDVDPFGDKSRVKSSDGGDVRRMQSTFDQHPTLQDEQLRREALEIIEQNRQALENTANDQAVDTQVLSDIDLIVQLKKRLLDPKADPAHLINVLIFWINLQTSQGLPNHNQVVVNVLQDMKTVFAAQHTPPANVLAQLNATIANVVDQVSNLDYDSTESIVKFVQITGVLFMRDYLLQRRVIYEDPETADVLTTWLYFSHIMRQQLPQTIQSSAMKSDKIFDCMKLLQEKVHVETC